MLSENRFSKYLAYAAGEIVLVVIGILIALQINNWNEQRKLNNNNLAYLANLKKEVSQNNQQLKLKIKDYKKLDSYHLELANIIKPEPDPIVKSKLDTLVDAMTYMPVYKPIKTFTNSDKLQTIEDAELKKIIALWNFELERYIYDTTIIYDLYYNAIYPFLEKNYHLKTLQSKTLGTNDSEFKVDSTKILSSSIFENQVAMKALNHRNAYNQLLVLKQIQQDIIGSIEKIDTNL